ncbi:MAG: hypothetical protein D8M59_16100 [Planctomycetes bacterium]|nr:hypothetical protein [Planctomycetota bacterium]
MSRDIDPLTCMFHHGNFVILQKLSFGFGNNLTKCLVRVVLVAELRYIHSIGQASIQRRASCLIHY